MRHNTIHAALVAMRTVRTTPTGGICWNLGETYTGALCHKAWLEGKFRQLGLDDQYPVEHPDIQCNGRAFCDVHDLWDSGPDDPPGDVEYRRRRFDLLEKLIEFAAAEGV